MIAIQSPPGTHQSIDDCARPISSPVADGGGAESARRRGLPSPVADGEPAQQCPAQRVFAHTQANRQNKLPDHINESQLIDALFDGSFDLPQLCAHFELAPDQLLEYLESPRTQRLLDTLERIAAIRAKIIAAQARVAATHRLAELATYAHTASESQARAFETA